MKWDYRFAESMTQFDPSEYERPTLPPCLRPTPPTPRAEAETLVHLAQVARFQDGAATVLTWCGAAAVAVVFDAVISNCEDCKRKRREAVGQ